MGNRQEDDKYDRDEYIERLADSEQERKAYRKDFKLWIENRNIESKIEEEKEVMVNEKYMNFGSSSMMLIALGVKKSVVSREWMREYLEDMKVDNSEIGDIAQIGNKRSYRSFRLEERTYSREGEVRFPIVLKTDSGEFIKREVKAEMIE